MNKPEKSVNKPLKTVRTETLPEGALFVGPDDVLYQVVMAGSAGFRKAEPWPPHARLKNAELPGAVALVPDSLLARNYPLVAEGRALPTLAWSEFMISEGQPSCYLFSSEYLAKLAAQLDETLAQPSGLVAGKEPGAWVLGDGKHVYRIYYYQGGELSEDVEATVELNVTRAEAQPSQEGPQYWTYLPQLLETPPPAPESTAPKPVRKPPPAPPAKKPKASSKTVDEQPASTKAPAPAATSESLPQNSPPEPDVTETKAPQAPAVKEGDVELEAKSQTRRTPAMILAIDIGYGYTKSVGPDNLHFSFPSVIGTAEDIRFATDLIRGVEIHTVQCGEWRFFYGDQAVLQSRIQSTIFDRSRIHDDTYKMLFTAALVELEKHLPHLKRLNVVTGLPVEFFDDRAEVIDSFEGEYHISAGHEIEVIVDSVFVVPQPFGSLFRELLNENGTIANTDIERGRVGVIDIGTYTTDFVVADALRYVQRLSGSIRIGWNKVLSQVQQALADLYRLELSPNEVDRAVSDQEVRVRGEPIKLDSLIEPGVAEIEAAVIARARDLWGEGTNLDTILVSGGGGPHLFDVIHDAYPHARLLNNAYWANAEGFYHFGLRPATFGG